MSTSSSTRSTGKASAAAQEFLAFKLGDEEYGMDILKVQEIRSYEAPTKIANAPDFIKGVVTLRGIIVPIVDMRMKFQLERVDYNEFTVVIIINVGAKVWGMVVDGVSDVIHLSPEQIKPLPEFSASVDSDYLLGMGSIDDRMVLLADVSRLMVGVHIAHEVEALEAVLSD